MSAKEMDDRRRPQEPEVATRVVLVAVFGFMAFVALGMGGLLFYFRELVPGPLRAAERHFPEPTLQISPQGDLDRFRKEQASALDSYAWVDRERGLAQIPIAEAMRLVAGRGARAYDALDLPAVTPEPGSRGGARR